MKLDAHPIVVAVALGLLGPVALAAEDEDDEPAAASSPPPDQEWGSEPDTEEIARVELEWSKVR
jgi:hypothetical protein